VHAAGRWRVTEVFPGSFASLIDLRVGDFICDINDVSALAVRPHTFFELNVLRCDPSGGGDIGDAGDAPDRKSFAQSLRVDATTNSAASNPQTKTSSVSRDSVNGNASSAVTEQLLRDADSISAQIELELLQK